MGLTRGEGKRVNTFIQGRLVHYANLSHSTSSTNIHLMEKAVNVFERRHCYTVFWCGSTFHCNIQELVSIEYSMWLNRLPACMIIVGRVPCLMLSIMTELNRTKDRPQVQTVITFTVSFTLGIYCFFLYTTRPVVTQCSCRLTHGCPLGRQGKVLSTANLTSLMKGRRCSGFLLRFVVSMLKLA